MGQGTSKADAEEEAAKKVLDRLRLEHPGLN